MKPGRNVWYDLVTTDVGAAQRFYAEIVGWKTEVWKDAPPDRPYTMWVADSGPIGGIMALPEEATQKGAPPMWISYTTVDHVDETVAKIEKLGGTVHQPAMDIPEVGRFATVADPQGATFAIFKPAGEMENAKADQPGQFSWAELNTTDSKAAWKFYTDLFGWKERGKMDMGDVGEYLMFTSDDGEHTKGGMSDMAKKMGAPPHWLHYITVDDMNDAVDRIKKAGGKIMNGPMSIPDDDLIAQCVDPQGAFFAIYAEGKNK